MAPLVGPGPNPKFIGCQRLYLPDYSQECLVQVQLEL
jgi:hypothetical protein